MVQEQVVAEPSGDDAVEDVESKEVEEDKDETEEEES